MSEDISKRLIVSGSRVDKEKNYWLSKLSGEIAGSYFPYDYDSRMDTPGQKYNRYEFALPEELVIKLNRVTNNSDYNLYSMLLGGVTLLLHKYTGSTDILIGAPIYKQPVDGNFINTVLVIRNEFSLENTFKELILRVNKNLVEANENMNYPIEHLLSQLDIPYCEENFSFFDTVVLMENIHDREYIRDIRPGIIFSFRKEGECKVRGVVEFRNDLYRIETLRRIILHFTNLLQDLENNINRSVIAMDILSKEETQRLLFDLNNTKTEYPGEKTIYELFEEQVKRTPDNVALSGIGKMKKEKHRGGEARGTLHKESMQLTYRELNDKTGILAGILIRKGIKPDIIVGIMSARSIEMVIGIIGILKSGGAYLPIDPEFPAERIGYMLKDSGVEVLFSNTDNHEKFAAGIEIIDAAVIYTASDASARYIPIASPGCLAYVIYTSGSTGRPKGVMISHRNAVNFITGMITKINFSPKRTILALTTISFDIFFLEVVLPLTRGLKIFIMDEFQQRDPALLGKAISESCVEILQFTPSRLQLLYLYNPDLTCLHYVGELIVGGEAFPPGLFENLKANFQGKLYNIYGPTETTVWSSLKDLTQEDRITVGNPIANTQVYIVDKNNNLQPFGVYGELLIGGIGVSRGYLNHPELTAEKFINLEQTSIFSKFTDPKPKTLNSKLYCTGDLARWLPGDNIEFLGRIDHQVKLRGFRIELGEIENRLSQLDEIKEAVVVVRTDQDGYKFLCSYFVPSTEEVIKGGGAVEKLRNRLSRTLPDYMIPTYFIPLEAIPLTHNGKIDRRALPEPKTHTSAEYAAPQNDNESTLAEIWQSVFGIEKVGVNDNFFALGGDSIKAIQISARLLKNGLKASVRDLFENPTIKALAKNVKQVQRIIDQGSVAGVVPLTPMQHYFFNSFSTDRHHFNISVILNHNDGTIDEFLVEKVLEKITYHHDALRMVYSLDENQSQIVQRNLGLEGKHFYLEVIRLYSKIDAEIESEIEKHSNRLQRGIDLRDGPLLIGGLFKTPMGDHLLLIIHHLVMDGISIRILIEDLSIGYAQAQKGEEIKFQEKTDSFLYWSHKLLEYAGSKSTLKEFEYWKEIELLNFENLPRDRIVSKEDKKIKNNETLQITLAETETEKLLKDIHRCYNTEMNDILMTALGMAINDWTGMENIPVSMEGHGREPIMEDVISDRTVGWFTTQFPVILNIKQSDSISHKIKKVKESLRRIPNKGVGYGILKNLTPVEMKQGIRFENEPEIILNYLGQIDLNSEMKTRGAIFGLSPMKMGDILSPELEELYTINIRGVVLENKFTLLISFNKFEYNTNTIEKFLYIFRQNLLDIIGHCLEKEESELTPSDVGDEDLSIEDLNEIQKMLRS
ncbi:MAG: amino acid adenylation domain-containing protein [Candidatus Aminicenantes bacterium]|nr:amino acid adenylation domain-containing protein [Candidatus Aminicenantes bacterium]